MARRARHTIAGIPVHVAVHGHNGGRIVIDDEDRGRWQDVLRAHAGPDLSIHAYLLLDDRFHLIVTPVVESGLASLLQAMGRSYARPFNVRHGRGGSLWQGRYRSAPVEPGEALIAAQLTLELWPVRLGLVERATQYRWSSARHHAGLRTDPFVQDHASWWALGNTPFEREQAWIERIDRDTAGGSGRLDGKPGSSAGAAFEPPPAASWLAAVSIEQALSTGRPVASADYLAGLEARHGVRLRVGQVGRPRVRPGQDTVADGPPHESSSAPDRSAEPSMDSRPDESGREAAPDVPRDRSEGTSDG